MKQPVFHVTIPPAHPKTGFHTHLLRRWFREYQQLRRTLQLWLNPGKQFHIMQSNWFRLSNFHDCASWRRQPLFINVHVHELPEASIVSHSWSTTNCLWCKQRKKAKLWVESHPTQEVFRPPRLSHQKRWEWSRLLPLRNLQTMTCFFTADAHIHISTSLIQVSRSLWNKAKNNELL